MTHQIATGDVDLTNSDQIDPLVDAKFLNALGKSDAKQGASSSLEALTERLREKNLAVLQHQSAEDKQFDSLIDRVMDLKRKTKDIRAEIKQMKALRDSTVRKLEEFERGQLDANVNYAEEFSTEFEDFKLQELTQTARQFERSFGIKVRRTESDLIQLFFEGCAGPSNPDIVCCCELTYTKPDQFRFHNSDPTLPDLDSLVKQLNESNDIRSFVIVLRQHFCRHFRLASAVSNRIVK